MKRFDSLWRLVRTTHSAVCALALILLAAAAMIGCDVYTTAGPNGSGQGAAPSLSGGAAAGQVRFVAGFRYGYSLAVQQGKPLLLFFTGTWCHFCHEMEAEAFADPQVAGLAERFVVVRVDADAEADVCRQFQVVAFPTVEFVSPRGQVVQRVAGKVSADILLRHMHAVLDAVARADATDNLTR
jgi:thiol:disulfide interchange protein